MQKNCFLSLEILHCLHWEFLLSNTLYTTPLSVFVKFLDIAKPRDKAVSSFVPGSCARPLFPYLVSYERASARGCRCASIRWWSDISEEENGVISHVYGLLVRRAAIPRWESICAKNHDRGNKLRRAYRATAGESWKDTLYWP